jgi:hypothetical protein
VTRVQVLATVNRFLASKGAAPLTMRKWSKAVGIARQNNLVSAEYLEWAQKGYFPTPAERRRGR